MTIKDSIKDKIDPRAIPLILLLTIIEFELFTTTRIVYLIAGRDSWLAALLGGISVTLGTYFLLCLMERFPKQNFFEYIPQIWGKSLAIIISVCYFLFWGSFLALLFKNTAEVNQIFFLEKTPLLLPILLLALGAVWLVTYGFTPIIRFIQIVSPLFIIPLSLIILLALSEIEIDHFLPLLANGITPVLKGALIYSGYFQGLELILFISPFLTDARKAFKPTLLGITCLNLLAFISIILVIGVLGIKNTNEILWPAFAMMSVIEIPGFPAERFELLLTFPLLLGVFITVCVVLYLLSYGIIQVFKISHKKTVIYLMALLAVIAILFIPDFAWGIKHREMHTYATIVFIYLLPLLTLLLAVLRKKGNYYEK